MKKNESTSWIKLGMIVKAYDAEDENWYDAKIFAITGDEITLEDIDTDSPYMGMKWKTDATKMNDKDSFRVTLNLQK